MVHRKRSAATLEKQRKRTIESLRKKDEEDKRKERREQTTRERIKVKDIEEGVPTERKFKEKKEIIQLNVKEKETIKLGEPTPEEFQRGQDIHQLKQIGKAALVGAGIGAATFFGGAALIGKVAAGKATQTAITSGFAQQAAVTAKIALTSPRSAISVTNKIGQMTINSKTIGLAKGLMTHRFGIKAVALFGAWASSVFLGRWGQAEAPEGIMIPIRDLIKIAETPEDWETIDEYLTLAAEISDTSIWEEIILWSPFSAVKGIMSKVKGVAAGVAILKETADKVQEIQIREQEAGETEFAKERRITDEAARERDIEDLRFRSDYFALIREGKFEEAEELLQEEEATISVSS